MLMAFERAINTCKSHNLRGESLPSIPSPVQNSRSRILCWLGLSLALLGLAFILDAPVARLLSLGSSDFLKHLAGFASKAGEGWVVAVAGIACSLFLFLRRRFQASQAVFLVASTGLLTGAAATIIRSLLGRTRPNSHELQGFYGVWHHSHWIIGKYEFGAFPSGHAATVIGLASAAWLINRRFGLAASVYAILVSWSRIAMGCHHFSDAVASAILGIYGAQSVLPRLGPTVHFLGECLKQAWFAPNAPTAGATSIAQKKAEELMSFGPSASENG